MKKSKFIALILIFAVLFLGGFFAFDKVKNDFFSKLALAYDLEFSKYRDFQQNDCEMKFRDHHLVNLMKLRCQADPKLKIEEFQKKLSTYIESKNYNLFSVNTPVFFPLADVSFKESQIKLKNTLLDKLDSDYEKSLIIKNFAWLECQDNYISASLEKIRAFKDQSATFEIISKFKECFYFNQISKDTFDKVINFHDALLSEYYFKNKLIKHLEDASGYPAWLVKALSEDSLHFKKIFYSRYLSYLDEVSQLRYISEDYSGVVEIFSTYQMFFPLFSEHYFFKTQKNIMTARYGKALVKTNNIKGARDVLKTLVNEQLFLLKQSNFYYPDFSLASLMLKKPGSENDVIAYINGLALNKLLEIELANKWLSEIQNNIVPNFELDIFQKRYHVEANSERYKIEESQIIQYQDN